MTNVSIPKAKYDLLIEKASLLDRYLESKEIERLRGVELEIVEEFNQALKDFKAGKFKRC